MGFFAIVLTIVLSGTAILVGILAQASSLHQLIVPILIFTGAFVLLVVVGVFVTAWRDPTILMLGQITGEVFLQHKRIVLGDSAMGEVRVPLGNAATPTQAGESEGGE